MHIKLSDHFTYKRLIRFTLPSVAMMIFTSIYSVVDGFFVSNFAGKTPFAAVNLIMPMLMILGSIGFMLGTGGTALVARTLGEGHKQKASEYFSLFVYFALALGAVLAVLGFIFIRPVAAALGASGQLLSDCVLYGRISMISMPFFILQVMFQTFFIAAEKPKLGLCVTLIAGITNMALDAALVLSFPEGLKLAAAAIATVTSEILGGSIPLIYFFRENTSLLRLSKTHFDAKAIMKGLTNGVSEFATNISMSIVAVLYNIQLLKYAGANGVAAYGVMMYVSMIFAAVFMGYSIGSAPIVSYNYGAYVKSELTNILRKSIILVCMSGVLMFAAAQCLAPALANIFVGYDAELYKLTLSGFRRFSIAFAFMGFSIYTSAFFTALNDGITSAVISLLRTMLFECAAVIILPLIFGLEGIWFAVVVAEIMAFIIGILFLTGKRRHFGY